MLHPAGGSQVTVVAVVRLVAAPRRRCTDLDVSRLVSGSYARDRRGRLSRLAMSIAPDSPRSIGRRPDNPHRDYYRGFL